MTERVEHGLTEALASHRQQFRPQSGDSACSCDGWTGPFTATSDVRSFAAHLSAVIQPILTSREQAARAEAWDEGPVGEESTGGVDRETRERLTDDEREAIFHADYHHPDHCDCSAYVIEQGFAEDDCCEALWATFAAVERIIAARVAAALVEVQARAERARFEHNENCATTDQWHDQKERADAAESRLEQVKAAMLEAADELDEWDGDASAALGGVSPGGLIRHTLTLADPSQEADNG